MMKHVISFLLAAVFVFGIVLGIIPTTAEAATGGIYCNVKFSKPAICCDAGETIDLTKCAVQFSASSTMTTSGITWTYEGSKVKSFTPDAKGVYTLTATCGSDTKTIYVVAKNTWEEEYVLYRNDFNTAPTDLRVIETTNGGTVSTSNGAYILNASGNASAYVRVLLPEYLDAFGDVKMEASMNMMAATDAKKWSSLMFRVQNGDYPYYQTCLRYDASASNGTEISLKNASNKWEVYKENAFYRWYEGEYNICSITAKGTEAILHINGYEITTYANTGFANGALGLQTRGTKVAIDYVEVTIEGNDPLLTSCDVSYAKPAIRADMGDTIDLSQCDVQFEADAVYTSSANTVWQKDGTTITTFTPTEAGVTVLTATNGTQSRNVYVVTRNLTDGEYVLYYNDFSTAPTDYRVIQNVNASIYPDGQGHYVIDASAHKNAYGRVLLPAFLDEFGDMKIEAKYKDTNQVNTTCWASIMGRLQKENYPYMQMCVRYDATATNGIEIAQRNEQDKWSVKKTAATDVKTSGSYNVYSVVMQGNKVTGYINGEKVISYSKNLYLTGAMGLQAKGLKMTVDYVKVTLGETTALEDTAVKCTVAKGRPAIGCNAGQTILLDQCKVQFVYGSAAVEGSQIIWKKDGEVITEFSDTSVGMHKLTATHGDTTMNVYVVAKKSTDNEYVLYENDFSTAPLNFRVPQTTNGSCYQKDGTFVLNASASASSYVRVLLPSYLDEFGDARLETSIKLTSPVDSTKWGSVMYRVQNGNYPYMQGCLRYDATADNGVEISQKNASNAWEVYNKVGTGVWNKEQFNTVTIDAYCQSSIVSINGSGILSYSETPYYAGGWGFQVRGTTMIIDYVRIIFTNNNTDFALYTVSGNYADVRDVDTGISIAPTLITDVKTMEEFENILVDSPAVAIMNYEVVDGTARVAFSDGYVSPDTALAKLGSKIIPAFRITNTTEADSLAAFMTSHDLRDAYAVSTDPSVVNRAYSRWKYLRGVVDYSGLTSFDAETIRYEAQENGARVLILSEDTSKETITALQDSFSCVWLTVSEGKTASVAATNKGPYGIITPDRALTEECYETFYKDNTLVRRVNVIGHRGNPTLAQENTVAGAQTAYANGATAVENDIYLVKDGVLMIMHDSTIDRTTNGSGKTVSFTSTQLKKYVVDVNSSYATQPIPSLEDYFKSIKGNEGQKLVIELKDTNTAFASALATLIKKYDIMDQIVLITFDEPNVEAIQELLPGVAVGLLNRLVFDDSNPIASVQSALELTQNYNTVCNPKYYDWGASVIQEFVNRGVTLWPWTINDQTKFDYLMLEGVGGITTDNSQWAKNYVENLTINSDGRIMATTYGGTQKNVTAAVEMVVVEDTLGISFTGGVVNIPEKASGGKASYFFRYKSTTPTGLTYYTVTDVVTVEREADTLNDVYYLFGYINGADYACEADYANMGEYKFVNGKLTATFTEESYVAVKTYGNGTWYMTDGWQGEDVTSAILYSTTTLGENANKLYVPANVEVTFTLSENGDGTVKLSYVLSGQVSNTQTYTTLTSMSKAESGIFNIGNVAKIYAYIKDGTLLEGNGDLNGDGKINIADVAAAYAKVKSK